MHALSKKYTHKQISTSDFIPPPIRTVPLMSTKHFTPFALYLTTARELLAHVHSTLHPHTHTPLSTTHTHTPIPRVLHRHYEGTVGPIARRYKLPPRAVAHAVYGSLPLEGRQQVATLHTHTLMHTHRHTLMQTHTYTPHQRTHTHAPTHAPIHAHTHTHTYTHTHTHASTQHTHTLTLHRNMRCEEPLTRRSAFGLDTQTHSQPHTHTHTHTHNTHSPTHTHTHTHTCTHTHTHT